MNKKLMPENTIREFETLECAAVDACSIIYMQKSGFLNIIADNLHLITLKPIADEAGFQNLKIEILPDSEISDNSGNISNDKKLINLCREKNIPVISEDKEVLFTCRESGLPHFNSIIMLNYLFYKKIINEQDYRRFVNNLLSLAHYGKFVILYSEQLFDYIRFGYCDQNI